MMTSRAAWGHGLATITHDGRVLDTWFPQPTLGKKPEPQTDEQESSLCQLQVLVGRDAARNVRREVVTTQIDLDAPPASPSDAYLRLHLISHRLVAPGEQNLDGILDILHNVVWTTSGPCAVEDFELTRLRLANKGPVTVYGVDKFPRMVDYVVPSSVEIADADRVRLGAHLAPGTQVMHEGFINYNAGTLGASIVEGRLSTGVTVGAGTNIGGGASIMGKISADHTRPAKPISIGARCLIGANSGLGIPLGDDCIIEAGLYLTAGSKVSIDADGPGEGAQGSGPLVVKARKLAGQANLLFRRHSVSGRIQAVHRTGAVIHPNASRDSDAATAPVSAN